ncbi:MAG: class I SAM-dependent methyltransferase [Candidatus Cloacimonetes bacterium]|nr:class I SAM-dependent methyltransferase [Candidatus Cloacimonadota bacterium]
MKNKNRVCPVWIAYTFDMPIRRLIHNPRKMFQRYVKPGMTVLDLGCGLGFFSLRLAGMVGRKGRVLSADLQEGMLDGLMKRARRKGVDEVIQTIQCDSDRINVDDSVDFALAFWMLHETPDFGECFRQLHRTLKPGGHLFIAEPKAHVDNKEFKKTLDEALAIGFELQAEPVVKLSRAFVLQKKRTA